VIKAIKLEKNIRWEFEFLDKEGTGRISLSDALFLFKIVEGRGFSLANWQLFLSQRSNSMYDYVTCDELVQALTASGGNSSSTSDATLATPFDDYMSNKHELSRMALERKQAIYSDLQQLVAELSSDDDDSDILEDPLDNEWTATAGSKASLIDKAAEQLQNIKKKGLDAFSFDPPKEAVDDLLHDNHKISAAVANTTNTIEAHEVKGDGEDSADTVPVEQSDLDRKDTLKSIINTLVLAKHKCLAAKLLADLVICNHADVPRIESLQNDYSDLLSHLPSDLRQIEEFSVDNKWTKALDKLFAQCDIHIYCLALIETDSELLEIFNNKLTSIKKFMKLMKWLGRGYSQELIAVERSLSQDCDLPFIHKTLLQFCYAKNAVQWEADFISALVMSKLLQMSFKEMAFIFQHKER